MAFNSRKYQKKYFESGYLDLDHIHVLVSGLMNIDGSSAIDYLLNENNYGQDGDTYLLKELKSLQKSGDIAIPELYVPYKDIYGKDRGMQLKSCTLIELQAGSLDIILTIDNRRDFKEKGIYLYTSVQDIRNVFSPTITSKAICRDFVEYDSTIGPVKVSFQPFYDYTYDNEDANPLLSNVNSDRSGSIASILESFDNSGSVIYFTGAFAEIADSFYTEQSNISPRYLGSKKGFSDTYIGRKYLYRSSSIEEFNDNNAGKQWSKLEPAFGTYTSFSGSAYALGTSEKALRGMSVSEIDFEQFYFATTHSIVWRDGRDERECYISKANENPETYQHTLPSLGDIVYRMSMTGSLNQSRVTNSDVYSKDLGAKLVTDDLGIIKSIVPIRIDITGSGGGDYSGSVVLDNVLITGNLAVLGSASIGDPAPDIDFSEYGIPVGIWEGPKPEPNAGDIS